MLFPVQPGHSPQSPIGALPPELLFKIFEFYISDHLPETLLSVCRYWHDVALHFPTLWSNLRPRCLTIEPKWALAFLRARTLRSRSVPIHLDLEIDLPVASIKHIPTLMERCVGITVRHSDHWELVAQYLPQLEHLTLALRLPPPSWMDLQPTENLKRLKIELPDYLPSCPVKLLSQLQSELELCFSWFTTSRPELCRVASAASMLPRLRLNIIATPQYNIGLLENFFFHQECIFEQVTHLILEYADERIVWHPLDMIRVPKLERLEILLHHLRTIEGLARTDYLTVTQLIVVMLTVPSDSSDGFGPECEAVLELLQNLPSLESLELTVPLEVMTKVKAEIRERNLCPCLSDVRHHSPPRKWWR